MTNQELEGAVGVVTGGASGIGRGLAEAMIARRMRVIIADYDDDAGHAAADAIGAHFMRCDVSSAPEVEALAAEVIRSFGNVLVVCNNAGVGPAGLVKDTTLADFRWMLDINLWGVIHGVHSFLPYMRQAGAGYFINTASLSGLVGTPARAAYAVSKFGVVALTEVLAKELAAEGAAIGASVLCPGPVRTNIGTGSRNRPDKVNAGVRDFDLSELQVFQGRSIRWLEPREAGDLALDGALRGDLYIQTHPELAGPIFERHQSIADSFAAVPAPR